MSPSRLIAIGVSCLVGYVVGGYVGLYVILSSRGFDNPLETELLFATIGIGSTLGYLASLVTDPNRSEDWVSLLIVTVAVSGIGLVTLLVIEEASPIQVGLIGMALSAAVAVTAGRAEGSVSIRGAG